MTTQSTHLYSRRRPAAERTGRPSGGGVQTRLPWWAVALPALAFVTLLALLAGGSTDATAAAPAGDLLGRLVSALPDLVHRVL